MGQIFNKETFRDDYTYANSPKAIKRFPFPFAEDEYMYSVNIERHVATDPGSVTEFMIDVDEHYVAECEDRAITLAKDSNRLLCLPHMMDAQWDVLELIMTCFSKDYPEQFNLQKKGNNWSWVNKPLNIKDDFVFGDVSSLPMEPLEYIGRQVQGDWVLMDQRDDNLFADAGIITSQADWSMAVDCGMSFKEWHGPVPIADELGVFDRALKYLLHLQLGSPVRRLNWTMTINPRLDTAPETAPVWAPEQTGLTLENIADKAHLRVELQGLFRLPRSNAIAFSIRGYLISMKELVTYPRWAKRMHRVLRDLNPELAEYKGISDYQNLVVEHLSQFDDGEELGFGTHPE